MTPQKLRGGYYTPGALVDFCLERARELVGQRGSLHVLEPSAGDGAFVRGLGRCELSARVAAVEAIELAAAEAAKAEVSLRTTGLPGRVLRGSALAWAADRNDSFDLLLGNPPFVRYQFIGAADKRAIERLGRRLGVGFAGVGNLWIPVLLGSLARVREGGAVAMVLPSECFTGSSAALVRAWLVRHLERLRFDLFAPGSFPGVLQEVTVLSGVRGAPRRTPAPMRIVEHATSGASCGWEYAPRPEERNWSRSLLEPRHREALTAASALPCVTRLGGIARIEVGIVTGANSFFCVDQPTAREHGLAPWARPLLARGRLAPGLRFTAADHRAALAAGARAWLLDFGPGSPDPALSPRPRAYLRAGAAAGLDRRFKCRTRSPWYRVPQVRSGSLMLSKRSHLHPRLLLNEAGALSTDTIYRGALLPGCGLAAADLVAGFHCSLTLLSAELEGRSFGGGVLELVPSEIAALSVIRSPGLGRELPALDRLARRAGDELAPAGDALLARRRLIPAELSQTLAQARESLLARRLRRAGAERRPLDAVAATASGARAA